MLCDAAALYELRPVVCAVEVILVQCIAVSLYTAS